MYYYDSEKKRVETKKKVDPELIFTANKFAIGDYSDPRIFSFNRSCVSSSIKKNYILVLYMCLYIAEIYLSIP